MLIAIKITAIVVIVALLPVAGWYIYGHTSITASIPTVSWNASDILDLNNVRNYDIGEEFKILQLTDTHFHGIVLNLKTRNSITAMIENTKPDLIVVTGDVCTSDANGVIY